MKAVVKKFVDDVKVQGKKAIRSAMRDVVKKVETDFMVQAQACMDNYYHEYYPKKYLRTHNLYDNGYHPYRRYRKNEVDVGVAFSSDEMGPYWHENNGIPQDDPINGFSIQDLVVNNFMQGIHGNEQIYVGANVDETMQHFTSAYVHWELDKYFENNFVKYMP